MAEHARMERASAGRPIASVGAHAPDEHSLLALQRTVGNHAIQRLLTETVQREKNNQQRAEKQRRVATSRAAIDVLKTKVKTSVKDHVFDCTPLNGGDVNPQDPKGLHAYDDGNLPNFVNVVGTTGSTGRVHSITWRHNQGATNKASTMFPIWMPADHVLALLALGFNQDTVVVTEKLDMAKLGISASSVKQHIQRGQDIKLGKSGETIYPVM